MIKATPLTDEFDFAAYRKYYSDKAIPLFLIDEKYEHTNNKNHHNFQ
ncbi:MAG: hypothetical protein ACE5IR_28125 [bacterium]